MRLSHILFLPIVMVLASAPQPGLAASANTLNFRDVEIREVAQAISEITGKNFILDPRVKGKVTVISARPIPPDAVYSTFLAMLQVHGFATVPSGAMIKIVPSQDARQLGRTPGDERGALPDDMVTTVIQLDNVSAAQASSAIRAFMASSGFMAHVPSANVIVIADHAANVARLERVIRRIDKAVEGDVEVIALQNATAGEVVRVVTALNQSVPKDAGGFPPTIVADDRTNSVLVGGTPGDRLRIRTLVTHLDTPLKEDGNTQVVYLRYAEADSLAKILTGYSQAEARPTGGAAAAPAGAPGGGVSILPEPDTNALVITAGPKEMRSLRQVIEKLDIRRAQVLVEAIIVEISQERAAELGVTWAVQSESGAATGLTNFGNSGAGIVQLGAAAAAGGSAAAAAIPDGLSFGVGKLNAGGVSFGALLRALAGDATSNVLSTPSLLTMDNEEAEFRSGQEVPFLTGQYSGIGGGTSNPTNPFQTIERKEVGVKLKIKPQVNEGSAVFLNIEQEVSSLASTTVSTVDAVTNKRTISTRVMANDGEIIVLGGLIDDNLRESEQRVPILGAIPVLGNLFRYRSSTKTKQNLMVFLRPTIINDGVEATYLTGSKYNHIRDLQLARDPRRVQLLQGEQRPVLPEFQQPEPVAADPARDEDGDDEPVR